MMLALNFLVISYILLLIETVIKKYKSNMIKTRLTLIILGILSSAISIITSLINLFK